MNDKVQITIPKEPLNVVSGSQGTSFLFRDFITWALNSDTRFNTDGPGIKAAIRIEMALESATDELLLRADDKAVLLEALLNPTNSNGGRGYPITPARTLVPWITAVEEAKAIEG